MEEEVMPSLAPDAFTSGDLLGLVAVTTFLVGFSTVRLQSSLQEWRGLTSRVVDRLLEQNAGQDLLPVPITLRHLGSSSDYEFYVDEVTWLSFFASLATVGISIALSFDELQNVTNWSQFHLIQIIHVIIFAIGLVDLLCVKRLSKSELAQSPSAVYRRLESSVEQWLKAPDNTAEKSSARTDVEEACRDIDNLIPGWCWLSLIREEVDLTHKDGSQSERQNVSRIRALAKRTVASDDSDLYSVIGFVWSSYLLDGSKGSEVVRLEQLESISKFNQELLKDQNSRDSGMGDLMSVLSLCRVRHATAGRTAANDELDQLIRRNLADLLPPPQTQL